MMMHFSYVTNTPPSYYIRSIQVVSEMDRHHHRHLYESSSVRSEKTQKDKFHREKYSVIMIQVPVYLMFTFLCMNEYIISKGFSYYHNVLWTHMFDGKTWKISIYNNMI